MNRYLSGALVFVLLLIEASAFIRAPASRNHRNPRLSVSYRHNCDQGAGLLAERALRVAVGAHSIYGHLHASRFVVVASASW